MSDLVVIENNIPRADSREIAQRLGIDHRSFFRLIVTYQSEVESDFGQLRFEIAVVKGHNGGGNPERYAMLTEDQSYVFLTYSKNTEQARYCKRMLVKAFAEARQKLVQPVQQALPLQGADIACAIHDTHRLTQQVEYHQQQTEYHQRQAVWNQQAAYHWQGLQGLYSGEASISLTDTSPSTFSMVSSKRGPGRPRKERKKKGPLHPIDTPEQQSSEILRHMRRLYQRDPEYREWITANDIKANMPALDTDIIRARMEELTISGELEKTRTDHATKFKLANPPEPDYTDVETPFLLSHSN